MRFSQEISIFNPHAIEMAVVALGTQITQTAEEIRLEAAATYATQTGLQTLSSRVSQTATAISFSLSKNGDRTAVLSMTYTKENGSTIRLAAQSIEFTGLVRFNDLSTSGSTTINGNNITTGKIKDANSNTVFNLSTGALTIKKGSINLGNGKFTVTDAGALTAKTGSIGGFTINSDSLSGGAIYQTVSGAGAGGWNPTVNGTQAYMRNGQVACGQLTLNGGTSFYAEGNDDSAEGQTGILCNGHFSTRSTLWVGRGSGNVIAYFRGYISSQGDVGVSDRNLKHHEYYLGKEAEDFIYSLEPVAFRWKDKDTAIHHGFYAQDVEKVKYDDWGIVTETDGHKGLFYTELIADLVATVQAQDKRIKALEAQHGQTYYTGTERI